MWRKDKWNFLKAVVVVAVAMAFVMPVAAVANVGTIGVTSDIENTGDMENLDAENTDVQPLPPKPKHHYFYGTLTLYGEPAPIGTEVRAEGINVNQGTIITTQVGYYGVPDPKLDVWGYYITDGTVLTFFVDGETTGQSYEFHQNEVTQFNLTTGVNNPPYVPKDPDPWDGETGVAVDVELNWTGGDPDGNPVTYDVYFGDTCPPPLVVSNQSGTTYDPPGDLDEKSLYYWQIVAWDNQSLSASGPIWTFITLGPPGVIYVDDDAHPSWYDHWHVRTIQEGVDNASSGEGDTVYVFKGTYHEHVTVGKQLEMVGAYRETVIIDGDGSGNVVYVTVSGVNISGFTMKNGSKGIYLKSNLNNINIVDCNVFGHTACGIDISRASYSSVVNCEVYDNVGGTGNGIYALAADHCDIIGCTAYNNVGSGQQYSGMGIGLSTSTYCKLRDNVLYDNQYNFGITGNIIQYYEDHDIDTSNTVNGKPIHFVIGAEDEVIDGEVTDIGLVILVRCNNMTVKNVETSNNRAGIMLTGTMESLITDCNFSNNYFGIWLYVRSAFNRIVNCNVFDNGEHGIRTQDDSSWNEMVNCNIYGNIKAGYWSQGTVNNSFIGCNIYNNGLAGLSNRYGGIRFDYITDNNLVEDCHIYGNWYGIIIGSHCEAQTIRNCELNDNILYGLIIGTTHTRDCVIENVSAHDNGYGIYVQSGSEGISMKNCTIDDNTYSFGLGTYSSVNIDTSNTINGKPIGLFIGESDLVFDETSDFGWLGLISCTNVTVKNMDLEGVLFRSTPEPVIDNVVAHNTIGSGIYLGSSPNGEITNCVTYGNSGNGIYPYSSSGCSIVGCTSYGNSGNGIYPYTSSGNIADCVVYDNSGMGISCRGFSDSTITNCDVYNNGGDGIYFLVSHRSSIVDCDIYNNQKGVYLFRSSDNSIVNCDLYGNEYGIHLYYDSARNTITNCDSYNNEYGIYVSYRSSDNNMIHHNNFVGNGNNSYDERTNQWDNGTIGNHWSDYTGVDEDPEDGIGDTPYNITGGSNQDRYPLMEPLLEAPELLLPPDGSGTEDQTPTFDWTDIKPLYPVTYALLVANDTGFTNIVIEETDLTESEYPSTEDMPYDTYYWKVQAAVGIYDTDWSETWSLTIELDLIPPTTPDLIEPTDESTTVEPMIFFDWTDAYDAYGIDYYILQVATDDAFADIVAEETPTDSECALALATADDYYWRTQAVDNNGLLGDWSETWMFTRMVDTTPPTVELTYPVGGEDLRGTVEITWTATDDYTPSSVLLIDIDYRCEGDWQVMSSGEENDGTYTWDTTLYPDSEDYEIRITTEDDWGSIGSDRSYPAITVDNTAPVTTVDLYPADPDGENNWYISSIHITLLATDEPSVLFATGEPFGFGVNYTMYRINEGDWQEYDVPFTVTEDDDYTLEFYSVDYAGNKEETKSIDFKIDQTAPTINLTVEKTGLIKWLLTATVSDETSGVAKVEFYLDGELLGNVTESPYTWEVSEEGTAYAVVYDNAGNDAISDPVPVSVSQSQSQSSSNLVPVQRRISGICLGGLTGIQNIQRRV